MDGKHVIAFKDAHSIRAIASAFDFIDRFTLADHNPSVRRFKAFIGTRGTDQIAGTGGA